jgi:IS5 family transposase
MQHWCAVALQIASMHRFARLPLAPGGILGETTILKFRHLLEKYSLPARILDTGNAPLVRRGLMHKQGTVVDATISTAPSSTKNSTY